MIESIVRGDAFRLPFRDRSFDVVVADPPYAGRNRQKKGTSYRRSGYIPYRSREWWREAWRVLRPSGWLYVVATVPEVAAWWADGWPPPQEILSWRVTNGMKFGLRDKCPRRPSWRPILAWQVPPRTPFTWDGFPDANVYDGSGIQGDMHEALPWPNQLPEAMLRWLLRPHVGARVLDLFSGTGACRRAAMGLGLSVVSVDLSREALAIVTGTPAQRGWALPAGGERIEVVAPPSRL